MVDIYGYWVQFFTLMMLLHYFYITFCQTLGLVSRLRVDFVLPLSQEQQEEQEQEEQEPLTKIYQKGVY